MTIDYMMGRTSFFLATAWHTTVVLDPAGIENLTGSNVLGLAESLLASMGGKAFVVAQASHSPRKGG